MKILYFANNRLGLRIARWLRSQNEEIVGLVEHPAERGRDAAEIREAVGAPAQRVFDGSRLADPAIVERIAALRAELGVSILFGYRIPAPVTGLLPAGCVNLHPAYLPFNRGAYPNVWSIVDRTPAGVTIHFVDERIDAGDIVAQSRVEVEPTDTGESLYLRLEEAAFQLFCQTWPALRSGRAARSPQQREAGTFHRVRDVDRIDEIELDRSYTARWLLDVLRARTFGTFPGAYFRDGNRKVYVTVRLREADEDEGSVPAETPALEEGRRGRDR